MRSATDSDCNENAGGEVDYFGFRITVRSPGLAALLSGAEEDVPVITRGGAAVAAERAEALRARRAWRPELGGDAAVVRLRPVTDEF